MLNSVRLTTNSHCRPLTNSADIFTTRYHAVKAWIHEMGIIYTLAARNPLTWIDQSSVATLHAQRVLVSNLTSSVDAIKDYLDYFLTTDTSIDNRLPLEEWFRFVLALFAAYKLSLKLKEFPQWDVRYIRDSLDLEVYFNAFIDRFRASQQAEDYNIASEGADIYSVLPEVLESARSSFIFARDHPDQIDQNFKPHIDPGSAKQSKKQHRKASPHHRGCPATGFWTAEAIQADMNWLNPSTDDGLGYLLNSQLPVENDSGHGMCPMSNGWASLPAQEGYASGTGWAHDWNAFASLLPMSAADQNEYSGLH